jgi:hypothetical protein
MACIAVASVAGDELTQSLVTYVAEAFGSPVDSDDYRHQWNVVGSHFKTEGFPQFLSEVPVFPAALRDAEGTRTSFGIRGRFNRQGYNWIDIYPVDEEGNPAEFTLEGRVRTIDLWVWGSNLNYYLEAYVRDYQGRIYPIKLGDLNYTGWKNLTAAIPTYIPQNQKVLPRLQNLSFVKFRVWTKPNERVDDFYIYFHQFKVLKDEFEARYDGDEVWVEEVQGLWDAQSEEVTE